MLPIESASPAMSVPTPKRTPPTVATNLGPSYHQGTAESRCQTDHTDADHEGDLRLRFSPPMGCSSGVS